TQLGNKVAASTREGIISVMREVRKGGAVGIPADPEPALKSGMFVPFLGVQALTSKFVPGLLKGHAAQGIFLHCIRLPDNNGFKVIVEKAPEALYSDDEQEAVTALSATIESYVRRWPSQYMWSMKRFKKRPAGEKKWYGPPADPKDSNDEQQAGIPPDHDEGTDQDHPSRAGRGVRLYPGSVRWRGVRRERPAGRAGPRHRGRWPGAGHALRSARAAHGHPARGGRGRCRYGIRRPLKAQRRQNIGVSSTSRVETSSPPSSMATLSSHLTPSVG